MLRKLGKKKKKELEIRRQKRRPQEDSSSSDSDDEKRKASRKQSRQNHVRDSGNVYLNCLYFRNNFVFQMKAVGDFTSAGKVM